MTIGRPEADAAGFRQISNQVKQLPGMAIWPSSAPLEEVVPSSTWSSGSPRFRIFRGIELSRNDVDQYLLDHGYMTHFLKSTLSLTSRISGGMVDDKALED